MGLKMREDSRVAVLVIGGLLLIVLLFAALAFRRGADDAAWEMRWNGLDDLDRAWIAAAGRSRVNRATLAERGELELAKGICRREQRRRAYVGLATLPLPIVAAILVLTGVVGDSAVGPIFAALGILLSTYALYREWQVKARYREVQDDYLSAVEVGATTTD
jgi:hypothetical protein